MPLLPWIDPENFNPGYLMRAHAPAAETRRQAGVATHPGLLAPKRTTLPAIDLDDPAFVYGGFESRQNARVWRS